MVLFPMLQYQNLCGGGGGSCLPIRNLEVGICLGPKNNLLSSCPFSQYLNPSHLFSVATQTGKLPPQLNCELLHIVFIVVPNNINKTRGTRLGADGLTGAVK